MQPWEESYARLSPRAQASFDKDIARLSSLHGYAFINAAIVIYGQAEWEFRYPTEHAPALVVIEWLRSECSRRDKVVGSPDGKLLQRIHDWMDRELDIAS